MATTSFYGIELPTNNADEDTWGLKLNNAIDGAVVEVRRVELLIPDVSGLAPKASPTFTGTVTAPTFSGSLTGNASSATKWANARTLTVTGDATGSVSFDGSANVSLNVTVAGGGTGEITIADVTNLQFELNGKQATGNYPIHTSGAGRKITVGTTQPSSPLAGDIWFDTA